ncbi:unnamed protein product [Haemonchus placei]|uniref:CARMIL_C domain-containing protein n=1 Tax=Haemonchus placei TaxID=6290 RepID=A0A0N4X7D2_HAEPC|nr:unnamed protein product [Haemonchus placei]
MAGRRTPPKHTLMDFIPPPPSNPPPPADVGYDGSSRRHLPRMVNMEDSCDSISDGMTFGDDVKVRLTRIRPQKGNRDDDSQRSSLIMDEDVSSSEADGETSDCEVPKRKTVPRMGVSASALS